MYTNVYKCIQLYTFYMYVYIHVTAFGSWALLTNYLINSPKLKFTACQDFFMKCMLNEIERFNIRIIL